MLSERVCSFQIIVVSALGLLPDRNLDTLVGKLLAKRRAFNDTWEFLRRIDLEWFGVDECKDGSLMFV